MIEGKIGGGKTTLAVAMMLTRLSRGCHDLRARKGAAPLKLRESVF